MFLLSFGFVVYAVPQPTAASQPLGSSGTTVTTNAAQGNTVYFKLVLAPGATQAATNASGYAGILVNGHTLSIEWYVAGATPAEQLQLVMLVNSSSGATKSVSFPAVQVTSLGRGGSSASTTLDSGSYMIGLNADSPTGSPTVIFTSLPASAQVIVTDSQPAQTSSAIGNSLSYSLAPLPVYLHQTSPSNYSFKEGGALIVITGYMLQVTTSFIGSPGKTFYIVLQTANHNITLGSVTTTSVGGGVFKANTTLVSGTYQIGLLIYLSGETEGPVAVSNPRAYAVNLPLTTQTSTTTKSSTTESRSSTKTSTTSTTAATHTSTVSTTTSTHSETETSRTNTIQFSPITSVTAPSGYLFGSGGGGYSVTGSTIYFSLGFTGQNPATHYLVVLSVNGTNAHTIGDYTTTSVGRGSLGASASLGTGTFVLSLTVLDATTFSTATAVLASVPSSFTVSIHAPTITSTSTTTFSHTLTTSATTHAYGPWTFRLTSVPVANSPQAYRFATSGTAVVTLSARHSLLYVELGFEDGNPSTAYSVALSLNGTVMKIGSLTTNREGGAELQSSIQVNPGKYMLGVLVYDVSAFKTGSPVLVMISDPSTQLALVTSASGEGTSSSSTSAPSQTVTTVTKTVTTINGGADVETQIEDAKNNLTIPATIQVTPLSSATVVLDPRFSISVGQQVGNGLIVAISGTNVTGPRVLLINMSRTSPLALYPALNITLDGMPVVEASSALQVLNPVAGDSARYVLVATSKSIQLLVSIPHFSLHLVQVAGVIVHSIQTTLELSAPLLAGSLLVITLAFAAAYAARKRVFSILV